MSTRGRGHGVGVARYMVVAALLTFVAPVAAQDANAWRAPFAAGQQARADGDHAAYAREMAEVVRIMPAGHLNRPFARYHAARGAALLADTTAAVAFLRQAWDEGIEALMISFAEFDSAFDAISDSREFRHVMGLAAEMELSVQSLGGSVHLIRGVGSNVIAQVGGDGLLLVDTGYAPALTALRRALGGLSGGRVARLILTHPHEDHMGSAAALGAAANVLAHPGTTEAMREPYVCHGGHRDAAEGTDRLSGLGDRLGHGVRLQWRRSPGRGHPRAHRGRPGGLFHRVARGSFRRHLPRWQPDDVSGQRGCGRIPRQSRVIARLHASRTIVVSRHDDPVGLDAVRAQIEVSRACMVLVRAALADGLTVEQAAERGTDFPPQWVAFFYRLLSTD